MFNDSWLNNLVVILSNNDGLIVFIDYLDNSSWFYRFDWLDNFWLNNFWLWCSCWCLNCIKEFLGIFSEEFALFFEPSLKVWITFSESVLELVFKVINLFNDHTQNLIWLCLSGFKEIFNSFLIISMWLCISSIKVFFKFGDWIIELELEVFNLLSKFSTLLVQKPQLLLCWFTAVVQSLCEGRHLITERRDKINHLLTEFIDSLIKLVIERITDYSESLYESCLEVSISIFSEHGKCIFKGGCCLGSEILRT